VQTILLGLYQLVVGSEMIKKGLHGGKGVDVAEEANAIPGPEKLLISIEQL
jgi:hypothetical protein